MDTGTSTRVFVSVRFPLGRGTNWRNKYVYLCILFIPFFNFILLSFLD